MQPDYFNNIEVKDGRLYKRSEDYDLSRLDNEYDWMVEASKYEELEDLIPEDVAFDGNVLSMKYYPDGDLGLDSLTADTDTMKKYIDKAIEIFKRFKSIEVDLRQPTNCYDVYADKTMYRMVDNPFVGRYTHWIINGKEYDDFNSYLLLNCMNIASKSDIGVVHGDFFFSNMVKDGDKIKLVDPRGSFGNGSSICGDRRYDLAKLRHSISGGYDYIMDNRYSLIIYDNVINYEVPFSYDSVALTAYFDSRVEELGYNAIDVKRIEGLLFLTMIPLHKDDFQKQNVFWALALEKLNG